MKEDHWFDGDRNPSGGSTVGCGFQIVWQLGPRGSGRERQEPNGATVEDVINAAMGRLKHYQSSGLACNANKNALMYLDLQMNSARRTDQCPGMARVPE